MTTAQPPKTSSELSPSEVRDIVVSAQVRKMLEWMEDMSLDELAPVVKALARKVYAWRLTHKGYVPLSVFEALLGPITVSVQIVHEVRDANGTRIGYALRKREANEAGEAYRGQYHNTCTSFRWLDDIASALTRDDADAFAGNTTAPLESLGITFHHEVPRMNMDMTFMHRRVIDVGDVARMNGEWRVFTGEEVRAHDSRIITSNIHQLLWVMDEQREQFGVLKGSFPKELLSAQ